MKNTILMISPGAIEGYPPVRSQIEIFVKNGFEVVVLTSYLPQSKDVYKHSSTKVVRFSINSPVWWRRRLAMVKYFVAIFYFRLKLKSRITAEISYDALGAFYSRLNFFLPKKNIVHLHEVLFDLEHDFYEKLAIPGMKSASLLVVADSSRAKLLQSQLRLPALPWVVRNVPMKSQVSFSDLSHSVMKPSDKFRVVYHGSGGRDHALDTVIRSMPEWPDNAELHLFGEFRKNNKDNYLQLSLEANVRHKIHFHGWIDLDHLNQILPEFDLGLSMIRPSNDNWKYSAGASNKRFQYMQAGIPQISDDAVDVVKLIEDQGVGFCISTEEPEAVARIVNKYYKAPALRIEHGKRARSLFLDELYYEKEFLPVLTFIKDGA